MAKKIAKMPPEEMPMKKGKKPCDTEKCKGGKKKATKK